MGRRSLAVRVGDEFELDFAGPAGAGYEWQLESAPAGFEPPRRETRVGPGAAVGGVTTFVFRLRAVRPGPATLVFLLKRGWEGTAAEREIVDIDAR